MKAIDQKQVFTDIEGYANYTRQMANVNTRKTPQILEIIPRIWLRVLLKGKKTIWFNAWNQSVHADNIEDARDVCEALLDEFPEIKSFQKTLSTDGESEVPLWYWRATIMDITICVYPATPDQDCDPKRVLNLGYMFHSWICERGKGI